MRSFQSSHASSLLVEGVCFEGLVMIWDDRCGMLHSDHHRKGASRISALQSTTTNVSFDGGSKRIVVPDLCNIDTQVEMPNVNGTRKKLVFVVNAPSFFVSHRLPLAQRARAVGFDVAVATPEGDGIEVIKAEGFSWYPIACDAGGMNPYRDLRTIWDLLRLFRTLRPSIVHNVTIKPVLYGTLAARLSGVPRVVNAIPGLGYMFTADRRLKRWFGIVMYRLFMRHPDMRVILQNEEDVEFVTRHSLASAEGIRLIRGSGVDVSIFQPTPSKDQPPVIMQTSRMLADKGVREFIQAARILKSRWPEARFLLVGPLYPDNPSAVSAEELNAAHREGVIEWMGYRSDVAALLAKTAIFCLASHRDGVPKSLLEAAACGLPLVTTNTSGCKEVVTDNENGLLVPVADARALAEAIDRLLADPALAKRLGDGARRRAEREFAIDLIVNQQIALYCEPVLHN